MKDALVGKIMTKFVRLKVNTYSFLTDNGSADKKAKGPKKVSHKKKT